MRRGFKSWCENTAVEYRSQLGLGRTSALDPRDLADHLRVLVRSPGDVPGLSQHAVEQLTEIDPDSWSAVTIKAKGQHVVILNSAHADTRQRNSLAHELAHIILNHRPVRTTISNEGFLFNDRYDPVQEEEADWLAAALLLPRDALLRAYRRTRSSRAIAREFEVSAKLADWRLRMTGVLVQVKRADQWRRRTSRSSSKDRVS